jgi:hypothetical protein
MSTTIYNALQMEQKCRDRATKNVGKGSKQNSSSRPIKLPMMIDSLDLYICGIHRLLLQTRSAAACKILNKKLVATAADDSWLRICALQLQLLFLL